MRTPCFYNPDPYSASNAECRENAICFMQRAPDFHEMVERFPTIRDYFYVTALEKIRSINCQALSLLEKQPSQARPKSIAKAVDYIDKNYMNPLTLEEVARINGTSKFHFSRIFKAKSGYSFKAYLNHVRIEQGKKMLQKGDYNVSEVCYAVGYNNLSYFSRVFNKLAGQPPSKFRHCLEK